MSFLSNAVKAVRRGLAGANPVTNLASSVTRGIRTGSVKAAVSNYATNAGYAAAGAAVGTGAIAIAPAIGNLSGGAVSIFSKLKAAAGSVIKTAVSAVKSQAGSVLKNAAADAVARAKGADAALKVANSGATVAGDARLFAGNLAGNPLVLAGFVLVGVLAVAKFVKD